MSEDPFAKIGTLDQKLFQGTSSPAETEPEPEQPQPQPPSKVKRAADTPKVAPPTKPKKAWNLGTLEPRAELLEELVISLKPLFDISEPAYQSNTYTFTIEELRAIEDMKLDLERHLDIKATKYDIVRCGVHLLIEDYKHNGSKSIAVKRLKENRRSR